MSEALAIEIRSSWIVEFGDVWPIVITEPIYSPRYYLRRVERRQSIARKARALLR